VNHLHLASAHQVYTEQSCRSGHSLSADHPPRSKPSVPVEIAGALPVTRAAHGAGALTLPCPGTNTVEKAKSYLRPRRMTGPAFSPCGRPLRNQLEKHLDQPEDAHSDQKSCPSHAAILLQRAAPAQSYRSHLFQNKSAALAKRSTLQRRLTTHQFGRFPPPSVH
jgi:hypothetical protein